MKDKGRREEWQGHQLNQTLLMSITPGLMTWGAKVTAGPHLVNGPYRRLCTEDTGNICLKPEDTSSIKHY